MTKTRAPVDWRRLVAVAHAIRKADPSLDHLEWSERIKDRILRLGLTYPEKRDGIHRAMRAVEHRHE